MELHEASKYGTQAFIEKLMSASKDTGKKAEPFTDPIREFSRASRIQSLVSQWLTYPIEERKRIIKGQFAFMPRQPGDPVTGRAPETDQAFESRQMERWRALCVIIQEESRAKAGNRSPEVAIAALKLLFPEYNWVTPVPVPPKE